MLPAHADNISATRLSYSGCDFGIFVNASHMEFTAALRSSPSGGCGRIELVDIKVINAVNVTVIRRSSTR